MIENFTHWLTHSIIRKYGKFHYIIYRIYKLTLLLVMATWQFRRHQKLSELFNTVQTPGRAL